MKRQPTDWEKVFSNHLTVKGLVSKIYKQLMMLNRNNPIQKMGGRPKQTFLQRHTGKDAQHCSLLKKCKSKLQRGTTSHQSEWPSPEKSRNNKC